MFKKIYNKILEYDRIVIFRHQRPDGDALGSQIGLKNAIISTFSNKCVKIVGDLSERLNWMGEMDDVDVDNFNGWLGIVLDCGSEKLISDERYQTVDYLIKIDHHNPQGEYGDLAYVDTSRESCAGIIAAFVKEMNMKLNRIGANALFTGMVTDSGRFRYSQTSSKTFSEAAWLFDLGIDMDAIYNKIYIDKLANVKLKAKMIDKFVVLDSGVAYLVNTYQDIFGYGITVNDASRGMVGVMSGIEEIRVWANFTEDESGEVYCEIRSNGLNIHQVAVKFGGGGHLQASGCTLSSLDEIEDVVKELERVVKENEDANI